MTALAVVGYWWPTTKGAKVDEKQLEKLLENYLAEGKKEHVSMFDQLKGLGSASQRIVHQLELHQQKDDAAFSALSNDIKGVQARIAHLEADTINTGRYNIDRLQKELEERKKGEQTLRMTFVNAGIGAVITLIGGLLALLVSYLLRPGR